MGYKDRTREKELAIKLRLQGKSYNEIRKIVGVPSKGTISVWLKNLKLTPAARRRLKNHMERATKQGLLKFNTERSARIQSENQNAYEVGLSTFSRLDRRELTLLGAALYWGEGTKNIVGTKLYHSLANSDPKMIACYMRFVREILQVPENKIWPYIHLYDGTTDEEGKKYWSEITKIPENRFYITRQVSRASQGKRNPKLLPYGTLAIRMHDRLLFSKMKGMIDSLIRATI